MDKLRALRTAVAIADHGSLTAAARVLDGSLPAVVRTLAALEAELGARLFNRTTRRVAPTEAGRRYVARARELLGALDEAEAELHAEQAEPVGKLSVTAPALFGERHVASGVVAFLERYPRVEVDLLLLDRIVNLVEEGCDVGLRIGALEDSSLIARHVGDMRRLTVAAPSYLAARGTPQHPRELSAHACIRFWHAGAAHWQFQVGGKPLAVAVRGALRVNQAAAAAQACVAGLGIGAFLAYQVAPLVESGALRVLLPSFEPPPWPIHLTYPEARLLPARTRAFLDFMQAHIQRQAPAWQPELRKRSGRRAGSNV